MGWVYNTTGRDRNIYKTVHKKMNVIDHLGDPAVYKKIILNWIFKKYEERLCTECILFRTGF
jgi:hypothetical protein